MFAQLCESKRGIIFLSCVVVAMVVLDLYLWKM